MIIILIISILTSKTTYFENQSGGTFQMITMIHDHSQTWTTLETNRTITFKI